MSITKAAQANHDELFPGHQSTLAVTDPEFVELFDNFALDEVIADGGLSTPARLRVILASLIAMQTLSEYKVLLGGALTAGVTPVEVKEIVRELLWRLLHPDRPGCGHPGAADLRHAAVPGGLRAAAARPHPGQRQRGQRQGHLDQRRHPADSLRGLPAGPERPQLPQRGHP